MNTTKPNNIDEYIAAFPAATQKALQQVRATIIKALPGSEEKISYAMPTFTHNGRSLVHFAAYKNHIGLYPVPAGVEEFEKDFHLYKTSGKGTIQFPLNKPMPLTLIARIVKFNVKKSKAKDATRIKKKQ